MSHFYGLLNPTGCHVSPHTEQKLLCGSFCSHSWQLCWKWLWNNWKLTCDKGVFQWRVFSLLFFFPHSPVTHNRIYNLTVLAYTFRAVSEALWHQHVFLCSILAMVVKEDHSDASVTHVHLLLLVAILKWYQGMLLADRFNCLIFSYKYYEWVKLWVKFIKLLWGFDSN